VVVLIKEITHWIPTPALQAQDDEFSVITPRRHHEERGDVMIQLNYSEIPYWIATLALQDSL
jgi:hypothetical protein